MHGINLYLNGSMHIKGLLADCLFLIYLFLFLLLLLFYFFNYMLGFFLGVGVGCVNNVGITLFTFS